MEIKLNCFQKLHVLHSHRGRIGAFLKSSTFRVTFSGVKRCSRVNEQSKNQWKFCILTRIKSDTKSLFIPNKVKLVFSCSADSCCILITHDVLVFPVSKLFFQEVEVKTSAWGLSLFNRQVAKVKLVKWLTWEHDECPLQRYSSIHTNTHKHAQYQKLDEVRSVYFPPEKAKQARKLND